MFIAKTIDLVEQILGYEYNCRKKIHKFFMEKKKINV
jgi:hypothetical protein